MGTENKLSVEEGWLSGARRVPSDNFDQRPPGQAPALLVIHNISLPPGQFGGECIEQLFSNCLDWDADPFFQSIRGLRVSSHLLIRRDGEVLQFVSFDERAWHAGQSSHAGRDNCNDFSIGIELEGTDDIAYTDTQYRVLQQVTDVLAKAYPQLLRGGIVGHSDIAPGRKTDPGPAFDWARYRAGLHCLQGESVE